MRSLLSIFAAPALALGACTDQTATVLDNALSSHVRILSSDEFEGRSPGTAGADKTVSYIIEEFRKAGLEPGGDEARDGRRKWTQDVPLVRADIVGQPSISIDGRKLTQGREIVIGAALNGASRTELHDAPMVFVGYGIAAPQLGWDDYKSQDMHGKVLVVLVNDPDGESGHGKFGGKALTYYGRWTYKLEEAARRGALGVLIVHESEQSGGIPWESINSSIGNTMFDIARSNPASAHAALEGWLHLAEAKKLFGSSGYDLAQLKALAQRQDFHPIPLRSRFSAVATVQRRTIVSQNVVGRVSGATRPMQTVIYSAHWDHLGVGEPDSRGDRIYNGARDNATGVAAMIEIARMFAKGPRPNRSVVFAALTAEDVGIGLFGATYYTLHPLYPLAQTVGNINIDELATYGRARNFSTWGLPKNSLLKVLEQEALKAGRSYTPDPWPEQGNYFRADHFPFARAGVPAISFAPGDDLVNGGRERFRKLNDEFLNSREHRQGDEWTADMDFTGLADDVRLLYRFGLRLATSEDWPAWDPDSEFGTVRQCRLSCVNAVAPAAENSPGSMTLTVDKGSGSSA